MVKSRHCFGVFAVFGVSRPVIINNYKYLIKSCFQLSKSMHLNDSREQKF